MNKQEIINKLKDLIDWNEESGNIEDSNILKKILDTLQLEPNPIQDIVKLNEERYGLSFNPDKAIEKLIEELQEFKEAYNTNNKIEMLDALLDICVVAIGEVVKMGYDPEKGLNEVVKEISSREQDPEQYYKWHLDNNRQSGEKWKKNKLQDKSTLYKADFEKAKIK